LPTVTVTVVPLATPGHKIRSEVIAIAAAMMWGEELFIAPMFEHENSIDLVSPAILKK
jgi:hypothetical protein